MKSTITSIPGISRPASRGRGTRHRYHVIALAFALAACSAADGTGAGATIQAPTTQKEGELVQGNPDFPAPADGRTHDSPTAGMDVEMLNSNWQRDGSFWASLSIAGLEVEHYESVESMAKSATAVIVGQVTAVVEGRELSDPDTGDTVRYTLLQVEVLELLRGSLPVGGSTIDLETIALPEGDLAGPALLFVRWKGAGYEDGSVVAPPDIEAADRLSYRLVSSQGVFIPGPADEARNPLSETMNGYLDDEPDLLADPVAREAISMTWDDLVALVTGE